MRNVDSSTMTRFLSCLLCVPQGKASVERETISQFIESFAICLNASTILIANVCIVIAFYYRDSLLANVEELFQGTLVIFNRL